MIHKTKTKINTEEINKAKASTPKQIHINNPIIAIQIIKPLLLEFELVVVIDDSDLTCQSLMVLSLLPLAKV